MSLCYDGCMIHFSLFRRNIGRFYDIKKEFLEIIAMIFKIITMVWTNHCDNSGQLC